MRTTNHIEIQTVAPTALQAWLARFPGPRARVLLSEYLRNARRPRNKMKTFIKRELLTKIIRTVPVIAARAIQNPDPASTVYYGLWWHALGNELKRQWAPGRNLVYTSGLNAARLGATFRGHGACRARLCHF